jgi:hypothetical protein
MLLPAIHYFSSSISWLFFFLRFLREEKKIYVDICPYKRKITDRQTFMHDAISPNSRRFDRKAINTMRRKRKKGKLMSLGHDLDINFSYWIIILDKRKIIGSFQYLTAYSIFASWRKKEIDRIKSIWKSIMIWLSLVS